MSNFPTDVDEGLSATPKRLSSKYFYDKIGDDLFVKIMNSPEYYLTNSEFEIMSQQTDAIIEGLNMGEKLFSLYELGAGDGTKTIELLAKLKPEQFGYFPIDISQNALNKLEERLNQKLPAMAVSGLQGEYFKVLKNLDCTRPKVILFLGSNIGNLSDEHATDFIKQLADTMNTGDKLFLGVDLKKSKNIILPAYNDAAGYTSAFNLNLLRRMNTELGANFDLSKFKHSPEYLEDPGVALSYIESTEEQDVFIAAINKTIHFAAGEQIHTEVSRKYDQATIEQLIKGSGLQIINTFTDSRNYFADFLLAKS